MALLFSSTFHIFQALLQPSAELIDCTLNTSDASTDLVKPMLRLLQASLQTISFICDILYLFLSSIQLDFELHHGFPASHYLTFQLSQENWKLLDLPSLLILDGHGVLCLSLLCVASFLHWKFSARHRANSSIRFFWDAVSAQNVLTSSRLLAQANFLAAQAECDAVFLFSIPRIKSRNSYNWTTSHTRQ